MAGDPPKDASQKLPAAPAAGGGLGSTGERMAAISRPPGVKAPTPARAFAAGVSSTPPPAPAAGRSDDDPLLGKELAGRVHIERAIARGGMGKVYYGHQVGMNRPCAIKILDPRLVGGGDIEDFTRRFLLEASIAAKLTHPNVVTIFDYGETPDGRCFIAMEYLQGRSLSDELKAVKKLSAERAIHITRQAARALREAHALGVVHRDMKPGNVYLMQRDDDGDFVKVLDFGLVKETATAEAQDHTQMGQIMGSPRYMAPEQVQGKHVDARTDVYAVGAMLYAMLAGRPPFDKSTDLATMMAHVSDTPQPIGQVAPDADLPPGLEAVVMRCLAKNPDQRYASMEELIVALRLRPGDQTTASDSGALSGPRLVPPTLTMPEAPPPRSKLLPVAIVLGLAAAGAGVFAFVSRSDETSSTGPAAPPSASAASASVPSSPPPVAPKATASLHVETEPPGAKIKEDGDVVCEATPCDIQYSGTTADPTFEHLLVITKSDYKTERKLVKVGASPFKVRMSPAR